MRSLKIFTWRITATLTTVIIAFLVTGELGFAMMVGGIEFVIKFFIYYAHVRAWNLAR